MKEIFGGKVKAQSNGCEVKCGMFSVCFISLLPHGTHPHFPNPLLPSSSLLTSSSSSFCDARAPPVICVTVDPCKEDRSNISPPVYEAFCWGLADMMIGADGRTGAPCFEVCNRQRWL